MVTSALLLDAEQYTTGEKVDRRNAVRDVFICSRLSFSLFCLPQPPLYSSPINGIIATRQYSSLEEADEGAAEPLGELDTKRTQKY